LSGEESRSNKVAAQQQPKRAAQGRRTATTNSELEWTKVKLRETEVFRPFFLTISCCSVRLFMSCAQNFRLAIHRSRL
jgi:hypothetical protein